MGRLLVVIMLFSLGLSASALAAEKVTVRSGVHPSYSRLVFDWDKKPSYTINKKDNFLSLRFEKGAEADFSMIEGRDLPNILDAKVLEKTDQFLVIGVTIPPGSRHRDFSVDNRIIIDVFNPGGEKELAVVQDVKPPVQKKEETKEKKDKAINASEIKQEDKKSEAPAVQQKQAELEPVLEKKDVNTPEIMPIKPPDIDPHLVTVSSTRTFGMAVFRRDSWLWIVVDDPELGVPPQIAGPKKEVFGEFSKIDVPGGIAYRLRLPEGLNVYGEAGGLLWRTVLTPYKRDVSAIPFEKEFDDVDLVRGASLVWPVPNARKVLEVKDPSIGDMITVVTVDTSEKYAGSAYRFVELDRLQSDIGLALTSRVDDLEVTKIEDKVLISRPGGLAISRSKDTISKDLKAKETVKAEEKEEDRFAEEPVISTIFNFGAWEMGGIRAFEQNQTLLMSGIKDKEQDEQITDLLTLAKLNVANLRSFEALGFIEIAQDINPDLDEAPEYIALRAIASAMAGRLDDAIIDLNREEVAKIDELKYWKSYTLAGLEDWKQAFEVLPPHYRLLTQYPKQIQVPLVLMLAEVALRGGDIDRAEVYLDIIGPVVEKDTGPDGAAWAYLSGEALRQRGNILGAVNSWIPLTKGKDDLYRAKAGLALTRLQRDENQITPEQAIDRLEGLRFAWRGDQLETLINYRLGLSYVDNKDFLKGLTMLRNAASLSPGTKLGNEVTAKMSEIFRDIFYNDKIKDIPPLDAITLYEEFKELTPAGPEGDRVAQKLAERLVNADLLGRAIEILQTQVNHRLNGEEKVRIAKRLAGIQLLDEKPKGALQTLNVAEAELQKIESNAGTSFASAHMREINLLRARALSETDQTAEAMVILAKMPEDKDVTRLKADISWKTGRWEDAAEAFQDLIYAEDISLNRPLNEAQAALILSRGVALNLSGNRVALAGHRDKYGELMKQTKNGSIFEVITRPRATGLVGSKETLTDVVGEVDLFGAFLDNYKANIASGTPSN